MENIAATLFGLKRVEEDLLQLDETPYLSRSAPIPFAQPQRTTFSRDNLRPNS